MSFLKRLQIPHVFVLLSGVVLVCSLLTYVIPSGEYQREERSYGELTRTVVLPGTYEHIDKHISGKSILIGEEVDGKASPVSFVGLISSIPRGLESTADIIFFIFIIGGVLGIVERTGTISAVIQKLLSKYSNSGPLLTIIIMVVVGIGGSTLGMGEEFIPMVPIFMIISLNLGYDRIYGLAMVMLAADVGFAAATTNPFTVQIAQGIAEVPLGSGIGLRLIFFAVCMTIAVIFVLRYGARIKKNPTRSLAPFGDVDASAYQFEKHQLNRRHIMIIIMGVLVFGLILTAVQKLGWWLGEMSGGFILIGILAILISGLKLSDAMKTFVKGMKNMVVAALVVGFAKAIQVVLMDGEIMDTIIYAASSGLNQFPNYVAAEGMLVFQSVLNFFIPSGSGQAAVTMPLMTPLADVIGISRQTAVMAFTSGDGFSNSIVPTSGVLMAMLALAGIPYQKWLKWMLPLFILLMVIAGGFLALAVAISY